MYFIKSFSKGACLIANFDRNFIWKKFLVGSGLTNMAHAVCSHDYKEMFRKDFCADGKIVSSTAFWNLSSLGQTVPLKRVVLDIQYNKGPRELRLSSLLSFILPG